MQGKVITRVEADSPAAREGLQAGDRLLSVNGEPVKDLIDYEALSVRGRLIVEVERAGEKLRYLVRKKVGEPLGLCFETTLMDRMQTCKNRCLFCFVDQMPKGIRSSLNVKDDDWRLSFIMGNYVTLTNVSEEEFGRILKRRVSPL
ncbi:MAG: PDZ domain-containing protein, partial [Clostridia bacterium]|nr:PDZ domain-containing protein [Clostridia bacterium]